MSDAAVATIIAAVITAVVGPLIVVRIKGRRKTETPGPLVSRVPAAPEAPHSLARASPTNRLGGAITLDEFTREHESLPLLHRDGFAKKCSGVTRIRCDGVLFGVSLRPNGRVLVHVVSRPASDDDLFFEVDAAAYPRLGIARQGTPVSVEGTFQQFEIGVTLRDVTMWFP